jgi:hypothetical protein
VIQRRHSIFLIGYSRWPIMLLVLCLLPCTLGLITVLKGQQTPAQSKSAADRQAASSGLSLPLHMEPHLGDLDGMVKRRQIALTSGARTIAERSIFSGARPILLPI